MMLKLGHSLPNWGYKVKKVLHIYKLANSLKNITANLLAFRKKTKRRMFLDILICLIITVAIVVIPGIILTDYIYNKVNGKPLKRPYPWE